MKKVLSIFLSLCLILNIGVIGAFAMGDSSEIITFEEFSNALKDEFAKYGIEWEAKQTDMSFVYTRAILENELIRARAYAEASIESQNKENAPAPSNPFPCAPVPSAPNNFLYRAPMYATTQHKIYHRAVLSCWETKSVYSLLLVSVF